MAVKMGCIKSESDKMRIKVSEMMYLKHIYGGKLLHRQGNEDKRQRLITLNYI
jgi:hypothetical protein